MDLELFLIFRCSYIVGTARFNDAFWRSRLHPDLPGHVPADGDSLAPLGDDNGTIFCSVTHQALQEPLSSK